MKIDYNTPDLKLANLLVGKTVRYLANKSKVTTSGVRVLVIESVEAISFAKKSNKRFVTVKALDVDDGGESKYRNLSVAGIDLVV